MPFVRLVLRSVVCLLRSVIFYLAGFVNVTTLGYPRCANGGANTILRLAISRFRVMASPGGGRCFP